MLTLFSIAIVLSRDVCMFLFELSWALVKLSGLVINTPFLFFCIYWMRSPLEEGRVRDGFYVNRSS